MGLDLCTCYDLLVRAVTEGVGEAPPPARADDLALLMYTSGTTGAPNGGAAHAWKHLRGGRQPAAAIPRLFANRHKKIWDAVQARSSPMEDHVSNHAGREWSAAWTGLF